MNKKDLKKHTIIFIFLAVQPNLSIFADVIETRVSKVFGQSLPDVSIIYANNKERYVL